MMKTKQVVCALLAFMLLISCVACASNSPESMEEPMETPEQSQDAPDVQESGNEDNAQEPQPEYEKTTPVNTKGLSDAAAFVASDKSGQMYLKSDGGIGVGDVFSFVAAYMSRAKGVPGFDIGDCKSNEGGVFDELHFSESVYEAFKNLSETN